MANIQHIGIVGVGRMSKAIAIAFAYAGLPAQLIDAKERPVNDFETYQQQALQDISQELQLLVSTGFLLQADVEQVLGRISVLSKSEAPEFLQRCDLIMEGVSEVREAKQQIFAWLDAHIPADCIVASTTSTFLVGEIAAMLSHPERVINAHWLNPAYLIPLVELSKSAVTSAQVVTDLQQFLESIGKVTVVCNESAGYIVPRIQALAMNEAARMVEEGVASAEEIDKAIRTGFGLRFSVLGMLEFIDWGGGDILYYASQYLQKELGERYRPPQIIQTNMGKKHNGMREGKGFYDYAQVDVNAYKLQVMSTFVNRIDGVGLKPKFNVLH